MSDLVRAFDADGEKILVPEDKVAELQDMGGRVATPEDIAKSRLDEEYSKLSTGQKIAGALTPALPYPVQVAARMAGARLPGELEAYRSGASEAFTGGLEQIVTKKALDALDPAAGRAYGEQQKDLEEAHRGMYTAGEIAGFTGAAIAGAAGGAAGSAAKGGGLLRMVPGLAISEAGGFVEKATARALAGLAERGAAGRAIATSLSLGARGGVEGALYGAAHELTEDVLGDKEVAADRLYAAVGMGALYGAGGGAVLGGAGSLAKSGVSAAGRGLLRLADAGAGRAYAAADEAAQAIAKAGEGVEQAGKKAAREAADAVADAGRKAADDVTAAAKRGAEAVGVDPAQELQSLRRGLTSVTDDKVRGMANELAFRQVGGGYGLQSTRFAKEAAIHFPNGTKDLGEAAIRHGIVDISGGPVDAALAASPRGTVDRAAAAYGLAGQKVGAITEASGARIGAAEVLDRFDRVRKAWGRQAGREAEVAALDAYEASLLDKMGMTGASRAEIKASGATAAVQDVLEQRQFLDDIIYKENKTLDPKGRVAVLRDLRRELEDLISTKIDEASGKAPGELKAEYAAAKKDYHATRILYELAQDSAARAEKNALVGLSDLAAGGGFGVGALAYRAARTRGAAAGAALLTKLADLGTASRVVSWLDGQLDRTASGLLAGGAKVPRAAGAVENPVQAARKAEQRIATLSSRPEQVAERAATVTQGLATTAPTVAGGVSRTLTQALAFLSSKLPPNRTADPLDPYRTRGWSQTEAAQFMRYVKAAEDPIGVLEDIERGKVTPEAVETIRALTPTLYRDLQRKTLERVADHIAKGKPIPFETRLRLGTLLDVPADPSLRPEVQAFLQGNVIPVSSSDKTQAGPGAPALATRAVKLPTQHSALDRITEGLR